MNLDVELHDEQDLIARLYNNVFLLPLAEFKEATLEAINSVIPFDSGLWASGVHKTNTIFSVALRNYPQDSLVTYAFNWQDDDFVRAAAVARLGVSFRNEDLMDMEAYYRTPIYREYSSPAGIEHALGTASADPITTIGDMVFLFRGTKGDFFSDAARDAMQRLMPHIVAAWRHRQVLQSYERGGLAPADIDTMKQGYAVVDSLGHIHTSDMIFSARIQAHFPTWSGPTLPLALAEATARGDVDGVVNGLSYSINRGEDRTILFVADAGPTESLTRAERRVAEMFADGRTQSQAAEALGVSISTIRNQLASVYRKLDVHNKIDLARAINLN